MTQVQSAKVQKQMKTRTRELAGGCDFSRPVMFRSLQVKLFFEERNARKENMK
jgi:hypothetical protein